MDRVAGYIVVEDSPMHSTPYWGIARFPSWPLDSYDDAISILLSDAILDNFCSNPSLNIICIPDYDLVTRYLQHCQHLGIPTKLFWVEAYDKEYAKSLVLPQNTQHSIWLGIDFVYSADASYLFDDGDFVFDQFPLVLSKAKADMTTYGLFNSFSDAICYAEYRATLDTEREGLEHLTHEVFAAIYQII